MMTETTSGSQVIGTEASAPSLMTESDFDDDESLDEIDETTMCEKINKVLSNKPWVLICGGITLLYYLVTGIQYWISDYMITTLKTD
jgi:sugar phosphate permease